MEKQGEKQGEKQSKSTLAVGMKPPWQPGQSGNPNGRPKRGETFAEVMREMLAANEIDITYTTLDKEGKPKETRCYLKTSINFYHGIIQAMFKKALQGDAVAAQLISNRTDGMPRQTIGLSMKPEDLQAAINDSADVRPPAEDNGPATTQPDQGAGPDAGKAPKAPLKQEELF